MSRGDAGCGTRGREGRRAHVMPEHGKATRRLNSKVDATEAGGIRTHREILWLADLYQHHLNWRRSAIDIEHPGAILEAF